VQRVPNAPYTLLKKTIQGLLKRGRSPMKKEKKYKKAPRPKSESLLKEIKKDREFNFWKNLMEKNRGVYFD
jgi:hypothetical protein